jgi:hypothetical protein
MNIISFQEERKEQITMLSVVLLAAIVIVIFVGKY